MSSFDASDGTRGGRQPGGAVMSWFNRRMAARIRRGGGKAMGLDPLLLITIGAKSGQVRETPVARFAGPSGSWYVVASANGAPRNPAWYHNIAAHPDRVRIVVEGVETAVTAVQLHGADRDEAWRTITAAQPRFAAYETKTDRDIPIIRLSPRPEQQAG
ncbi:MAG TPA: nitroreductase/quinone reductase family protein [Candidatus Nanopelagicales bacterium]|nr:nitroreductase/quinone reductase family protein [Candidatus Nanopelagicales bacterium]